MGDCAVPFEDPLWAFGDNLLGPCSGHGQCVDGTCVCDEGWTGLSDWINADGYDCQINKTAYKVTWMILLGVQVFAVIVSVPYLKARADSFLQLQRHKAERGERYTLLDNRGALSMLIWYTLGAPTIIIMSILKLVKDDERVGITVGVSICYGLVRMVFYLCYVLFQPQLLEAIMRGSKKTAGIITWNRRISYAFFIMHFFAAFLPFVSIAQPAVQQEIYLLNTFIMFATAFWLMAQAVYVTRKLSAALDSSYEMSGQEKTLVMKRKMRHQQGVPIKQAPVVGSIYLLMFVWPFLWTKHDYILAITWIMFPLVGLRTAKTSITASESRSIAASQSASQSAGGAGNATSGTGSRSDPDSLQPVPSTTANTFLAEKLKFNAPGSFEDSTGEEYV